MKILFIGDYSNLHACLASELRRLGHQVTVVSDGGKYQQTKTDVLLSRGEGRLASIKYLTDIMRLWPELRGYDVVQLINPHFLNLKPGKLAYFLRELARRNGSIFLTLCGNDYYYVHECVDGDFRFSEFRVGRERTPFATAYPQREQGWLRDDVRRYNELLYSMIAGGMAVLPEYMIAGEKVLGERCRFTNIPIDLTRHPYRERDFREPLSLMVGMKPAMETQKGTSILLETAKTLQERHPDIFKVEKVSGLSYPDYLKKMENADVLFDQLFSYSPATNALDAMAMGVIAVSGAEPEYYDLINEPQRRPVVQVSPLTENLEEYLFNILSDADALRRMSREGREIVERHNDVRIVARKFLKQWEEQAQ